MLVKINRVDGQIEMFQTSNYMLGKAKLFHPIILSVTVYSDDGKKIATRSRCFKFLYKHFIFKSKKVQELLKKIVEEQSKTNTENNVPDEK